MGALGSDIATQTADIALMDDDLMKIVSFSIAVKVIFMVLAFTGEATLWMAVFADMGGFFTCGGQCPSLARAQ